MKFLFIDGLSINLANVTTFEISKSKPTHIIFNYNSRNSEGVNYELIKFDTVKSAELAIETIRDFINLEYRACKIR